MRRFLISAMALLVSAGLSFAPIQSAPGDMTVSGTVVSQIGNNLVLKTNSGDIKFFMESDVRVPRQLDAGDKVTLTYKMRDNDKVVTNVSIDQYDHPGEAAGTKNYDSKIPAATTTMGTVVATSDTSLVVKTDDGEMRYVIESATTRPSGLRVGDRVNVTHSLRNNQAVATRVSMASGYERAALPATASWRPLLGFVGLLALAGGFVLRLSRA